MSITAIAMITDALRDANVIDENQTPEAEMGVAGLRTLNQMLGQWDRDGIKLGWQVVAALDDTLPLEFQDERAVRYNLACELAGEYGIDPLPRVQKRATDTYDALAKAHRLKVECKLDHLPAEQSRFTSGSIESGGF